MAFKVYILSCCDGSFYTGYTGDIEKRLKEHSLGRGSKYVRARLPVKLIYFESFPDRSSAMRREKEIKKLSRKQKELLVS